MRLAAVAGVVVAGGCGEFIRHDRSPVTLVIESLEASPGQSARFSGTLQSDVLTSREAGVGALSDTGRVTLRSLMKDVGTAPSPVNAVTISRYRVAFRRVDGRNAPGVDVPFAFDSAMTLTVPPGGAASGSFELVRRVAKAEAPLAALAGTVVVISTIAEITFFGRDQAGNELSVTGSIGVHFGDFADGG